MGPGPVENHRCGEVGKARFAGSRGKSPWVGWGWAPAQCANGRDKVEMAAWDPDFPVLGP